MTATIIIVAADILFVYQLLINIEKCCSKCTRSR